MSKKLQLTVVSAMMNAFAAEMKRDPSVFAITNNAAGWFGPLPQTFPDRFYEQPISEAGTSYFGIGMALSGFRPIIDLGYVDFSMLAMDSIVQGASKMRFCSQGKISVPAVWIEGTGGLAVQGGRFGAGCGHSQSLENVYLNIPGIKVVEPSCPLDAYGLLRSAIRDDDPVIFMPPKSLLGARQEVDVESAEELDDEKYLIDIGHATKVVKEGDAATIMAVGSMVPEAMKAAAALAEEGISVEVIDPRSLYPFDAAPLRESVQKTGRLICVQEAHRTGGFACDAITAVVTDAASVSALKREIKVLGALNTPIAAGNGESYIMPHASDVIAAVKELL